MRGAGTAVRLVMLAGLALLLTGCLKLDMDLRIQPDDTVDGAIVIAVDKGLLELTGGSAEDVLGEETPLPPGVDEVTTEAYEDEDYVGQRFVFDGAPLSAFADPTDPESLRIVREGDTFSVSGVLDLSSGPGVTGATGAEQFLSSAEVRVAITFPGEVISSNGRVDGNTVVWEPKFGERLEIRATGSAIASGGGPSSTPIAVLVAVLVVVLAIVGFAVMYRKKASPPSAKAGEEVATGAPADEAGSAAPPAPLQPPSAPPAGGEVPPPPPPPMGS